LVNDPDLVPASEPDQSFKVWPSNADRSPFRQAMGGMKATDTIGLSAIMEFPRVAIK
jgi:hypothetical protein